MDFNIVTLGCKVNQYESEAMREDMLKNGFSSAENKDFADIFIINTCTVTSVSDAKNRKLIHRIRRNNPSAVIVLTGCMPQAFPDEMEQFNECDIILGNKQRTSLVPSINRFLGERTPFIDIPTHENTGFEYENLSVSSFGEHTRAFIKIEDGCNRFCSYCIIPYARGRVRSKPLADLKKEIQSVAAGGYKEVVLDGRRNDKKTFGTAKILSAVPPLAAERLRQHVKGYEQTLHLSRIRRDSEPPEK